MRKTLLFFCLLISIICTNGQSISPQVYGNAGEVGVVGTTKVSWTIGESLIETATGTSTIITEGFQQPHLILLEIETQFRDDLDIKFYPNPASEEIWVEIVGAADNQLYVELIDINGKILSKKSFPDSKERISIDLSRVAIGNYFLRVLEAGGETQKSAKIRKIY